MINNIKAYIKENWYLLIFIICVFASEVLVRYFCGLGSSILLSKSGLFLNCIYLLIITSLISLIKGNSKKVVSSILLFLYSFYNFAQSIHYLFFKTFFSFKKLTAINELNGVINEVIMKFEFKHLLFLLPFIIYLLVIVICKQSNDKYNFKTALLILIISVLIYFTGITLFNNYINKNSSDDINGDSLLYKEFNSRIDYYDRFGSCSYIIRDIKETISSFNKDLTSEEIEEINKFIGDNTKNVVNNSIYENKNLILILCESFSNKAIDENLTPTLYKLTKEGTYYSNFYAPLYPSNTCDSEFIVLTGMIPSIDYGTTSKEFADNYYPYALPKLFKEKGYSVNSYHSFDKAFYNREELHFSLGFDYFYDRNDLEIFTDNKTDYINWPDDKELFKKAIDNTDLQSPFFDFIITASGHLPYYVERDELWENYEKVIKIYPEISEQEAFYYASQMKLDEGLETLINLLKENNLLEDTVIILFGDHYPYGLDDTTLKDMYGDTETYQIYKTPMIIYGEDSHDGENTNLASTFDLYPTIISLFNLDNTKEGYAVGNDLSNGYCENELVLFSDRSILANNFFYNSSNGEVNGEDTNNLIELSKDYFKHSQMMLAGDYFRKVNDCN